MEKFGTARQVKDGNIIRYIRIACWIIKATNTHSEYVILVAFPLQQWLRERVSMLRYTYNAAAAAAATATAAATAAAVAAAAAAAWPAKRAQFVKWVETESNSSR